MNRKTVLSIAAHALVIALVIANLVLIYYIASGQITWEPPGRRRNEIEIPTFQPVPVPEIRPTPQAPKWMPTIKTLSA